MIPAAYAALLAALLLAFAPKPPLREGLGLSQAVYDREGKLLRLTLAPDGRYRLWVPLEGFSPELVRATLLQEDRRFRDHPGFNPVSLARAAWRTYVRADRRVGGSTITMQLARLRYRIRSRSLPGKLRQILKALQLERHYSKDEILEAYLNLAPYGGNIEGAAAASRIYFRKSPAELNLPEALSLAVLPQNPAERGSESGGPESLRAARAALFRRWTQERPEDAAQAAGALRELPLGRPRELPFQAPQFADALLGEDHRATPELRSTLDSALQAALERSVAGYLAGARPAGIRNAAALLVDHRTMEILASVGSADFFDPAISGQVDGTRALRSPGSTLKPFLYALAMDQGHVHPRTVLKDAPASYGGFDPENFDGEFRGPVSVHDALIESRNLPALQAAAWLKEPDFYDFLKSAGIRLPKSREFYGLAPALGGAELSMRDLARLYAMLANGGVLRELTGRLDAPPAPGRERRLLSPEAAFLVLDILRELPRPGQSYRPEWTGDSNPVYWKTGTSYAFRDAWSVGIFGQFVLAVWIGNFDGEGNPAFVGNKAAGPLFFRIVDALRPRTLEQGLTGGARLGSLIQTPVCPISGMLPGDFCPRTAKTWFIPGKSPIAKCEVHRLVLVEEATGRRACRFGAGTRPEVFEFWPSDLLGIFRQAGIPRRTPPHAGASCPTADFSASGPAPTIVSPEPGSAYSLRLKEVGTQTIPLSAVADADVRELFWFSDGRFLGKAKSGENFFWTPRPGRSIVRVVDDHGRSGASPVQVSVVE